MLKKSLSQHLLKDRNILKKMLSKTDIDDKDTVIEIGAGKGDLTRLLAASAKKVYAVEIDTQFSPYLDRIAEELKNVEIIYEDFLEIDLKPLKNDMLKVIGNIPYKITGPILFKLFKDRGYLKSAFLTVQKEVAQRIVAEPKTSSFGSLSVISQVLAHCRVEFYIPPHVFFPAPKVESAFVSMRFKKESQKIPEGFFQFVRNCFRHKRKLLWNSLRSAYDSSIVESLFEKARLERSVRAEELPPEKFLELFYIFNGMHE
ncbi:MAG: 16S rRNA (adenine(1518)-N(6)/adenine(1519)-N(6))-dimethyltransferase RsmA [Desulfobacterota bacterium]|nr:16S rRNA (adenine(1518)-N(6)/adenine(1519)-N(6))-dimethyltransferase RsmA [Thermodesulfobacteriota bacterium]MDW8002813.1 16S rRNA (adenine(1518)-N(6)/adenine(1519)-N(6))-dimethyltransferase RsmA [Deltaproteobacteria bacterium]